jgi:alkylation response protein AidB-like acyl-CoA dehydrogenase
MNYPDLDLNLTEEQKMLQEMVEKFAMEVVRPAGIEIDKIADPAEALDGSSPVWSTIRQYRELGLHKRGLPETVGGLGGQFDPLSMILTGEALAYADTGLSTTLGGGSATFRMAAMTDDTEMQGWAKDFCADTSGEISGCWAITEPNHGSDWMHVVDTENASPEIGPDLKARLHGDEYILTGQKSSWVSNGALATHATLHVGLDDNKGMQGTGLAIVPLDLPGISKGKPLDKIGLRALNQGEIFFDEVRIPRKMMVVSDPSIMNQGIFRATLTAANGGMSIAFAGLARAAFDEGLKYAKERVQGGVPIFEHQNIRLKLFDMFRKVESARALCRRVVLYNSVSTPGSLAHAAAAKIESTRTAFEVATETVQIHGGNGLSREYLAEKLFRDARAGLIMDGTNEALALKGSSGL